MARYSSTSALPAPLKWWAAFASEYGLATLVGTKTPSRLLQSSFRDNKKVGFNKLLYINNLSMVEAPGFAPGSENTSPQESTMRIRF
jgi:hypothetical protein